MSQKTHQGFATKKNARFRFHSMHDWKVYDVVHERVVVKRIIKWDTEFEFLSFKKYRWELVHKLTFNAFPVCWLSQLFVFCLLLISIFIRPSYCKMNPIHHLQCKMLVLLEKLLKRVRIYLKQLVVHVQLNSKRRGL